MGLIAAVVACGRRGVPVVALVVAVLFPASAGALPAQPPPQQALAVTPAGVVWASSHAIVLKTRGRKSRRLAALGSPVGPYVLGSAGDTFALLTGAGLWSGTTSGGAAPLGPGRANGCWQPQSEGLSTFFAVAAGRVVLDAKSTCGPTVGADSRQPVFVHPARSGRWRVLTWVAGSAPPLLASQGELLAIGSQESSALMRVRVLNIRSGRTLDRFSAPDAYLQFAGPTRLVLTTPPVDAGFPLGQVIIDPETLASVDQSPTLLYRPALYSVTGHRLNSLGLTSFPPLVSHQHVVTIDNASGDTTTLSVRSLRSGATARLISFLNPARTLLTAAFGWPTLGIDSTSSKRLPTGEYNCGNFGYFARPSAPAVHTLDLDQPITYTPAPPGAPAWPYAKCGPPPS